MKGYKMIICDICGSVAEVPANKRVHCCNNPSCEKKAKENYKAQQRKPIAIKRETPEEQKAEEQKAEGTRTYREDEIIYVKDIVPEADTLVMDVLEFAKELGALRFKGEELRKKLRDEQSKADTKDSEFLHKLESMQSMTVKDAIDLIKENGKNRTDRRDKKTLSVVMNILLNGIIMNPHEYAVKSIKNGVKTDVAYAMDSKIGQ